MTVSLLKAMTASGYIENLSVFARKEVHISVPLFAANAYINSVYANPNKRLILSELTLKCNKEYEFNIVCNGKYK